MFGHAYFGNDYFNGEYFGPLDPVVGGRGRRKKDWTPEEVKTFEAIYGGVTEPVTSLLEVPTIETTPQIIEDDIALILAIVEATEKNTYYTV